MAKYGPITKTLKKATPVVRTADNVVKSWSIEVMYSTEGTPEYGPYKATYSENEDVEYMGKTADQFTQAELLSFMPDVLENHVFDAHYEAHKIPPKEETLGDFNFNDLPLE